MRTDLDTFMHFIGQQAIRGKLSANTQQSYYSSINRIFDVATERERADVLKANLDILFARFRQKNSELGQNTLASYEGRVRAAINSFGAAHGNDRDDQVMPPSMGTLSIPLRAGTVRIDGLPNDLTAGEAKRIAALIVAMAE